MRTELLAVLLLLICRPLAPAGPGAGAAAPAAAVDAWRGYRFGLFIHWGVASGRALPQSHSHARKSALNPSGSVPPEVYDNYYKEFNPVHYDPDAWLKLAHDAGMRYAVFVAKHHDGFAMFKSSASEYNVTATPYAKDVSAMFAEACRRQGLALGWQISPKDWKHPDFNTTNHDRYNAYYEQVIGDLATRYGPISVLWFDGIEPAGADKWKGTPARIAAMVRKHNPNVMLGNHGGVPEDFISFEQLVAPFDRTHAWEMTEQINPSGWVYNKPMPTRALRELLRDLVYTVARDGNYLLDVGPMPDGNLYPPDADRLREFAAWMKVNGEGIHGTRGGPYRDGAWGGATCKGNSAYLFLSDRVGERLTLPALGAKVVSAKRLDGSAMEWSADASGLRLALKDCSVRQRPVFTCVKLELDRPAFGVPVVDGQRNLAASAKVTPSSVRGGDGKKWGPQLLFDNRGDTAWDPEPGEKPALEFDFGEAKTIASMSFAQAGQREGWNGWFEYELKARQDERSEWRSVVKDQGTLGGVPVIEFPAVRARFVRLELVGRRPVELAELRLFGPLEGR